MPDGYSELLDAAIRYLQELKADGQSWVQVDPARLAALAGPSLGVTPRAAPSKPASRRPLATVPSPLSAPASPTLSPSSPPSPVRKTEIPRQHPESIPSELADSPRPPAPVDKASAIAALRERVLVCEKCPHLVRSRKSVVFGVGDIHSPLMFVGEAPGADEDVQGEPFVGAAGQLLTRIIKAMGYTRETVYIANVLKCRPDTPGQSSGNRKPTGKEMQTCLPYLLDQIRLIQPKVIVALGGTAMEGLFGLPTAITRARGQWRSFDCTPVMPTYHPSYLLRNQAPAAKREVWEDMLQVLERLGAAISEKQRNYFKREP